MKLTMSKTGLMLAALVAALCGCDEQEPGLVARTDYSVPAGWTPKKIMGKDFRPMLYPGEWACGGTHNDKRAKEIGMWPRPDLPLYRDCALFIYAERKPEGRIEIPNWWKPETWTWQPGSRRGKTGPVSIDEFFNEGTRAILAENPKPDVPFLLQLSSSRAAFQTDVEGTRDVAGFREWRRKHPNFIGFEMLAESENDVWLYTAHIGQATNELVKSRMLRDFAPAKDQRGWVDFVRKMWDREKVFHFNETQNWAMAAGCYSHLHIHGINGAGGLAYEGSASQPLCTWQVAGAFLRGASRQFGNLPYSWYMAHFYNGYRRDGKGCWGENKWCKYPWSTPDKEPKPGDRDYPHRGTSRSLVARQEAYGYFIGASFICPENDHMLFYERDKDGKYVPGAYARDLNDLYVFSTNCVRGAAYATTAVLVPISERYGHSFRGWGGSYDAKPGWFDDVISQHALYRTLVPINATETGLRKKGFQGALFNTKFGDFWDVLVPDAGQDSAKFGAALAAYKCAFLIGAYRKDELDTAALERYVRDGGTLFIPSDAVETGLVPTAFAGLAFTGRTVPSGTSCTDERGVAFELKDAYAWDVAAPMTARPVAKDDKGHVAIWANDVGKGRVVTVACWRMLPSRYKGLRESLKDMSDATCARYEKEYWEPLLTGARKCGMFEYLFARVQDETLPIRVDGDIHFGVNRTPDGWNVWLINHKGVIHYSLEPEEFNPAETAHVTVGLRALAGAKVTDLRSGATLPSGRSFSVDVAPGEWKLIHIAD